MLKRDDLTPLIGCFFIGYESRKNLLYGARLNPKHSLTNGQPSSEALKRRPFNDYSS